MMIRFSIAAISLMLLLVGCDNAPKVSGVDLGGPSGCITASGPVDGQRGIDYGSIYFAGKRLVVWTDVDGAGGAGGRYSGGPDGVTGEGHLGNVTFSFEIPLDGQGAVKIDDQFFQLENGVIFLVSSEGGKTRIKQLQRNLDNLSLNRDGFTALMRDDDEFNMFFNDAGEHPKDGT
ncbi:hypothetical protein [Novipirellula sp.]|uniref:hypothetical protein n=1 Tax=Novipirellula sp. TaxID=2795430 RepID=UPI00356653E2